MKRIAALAFGLGLVLAASAQGQFGYINYQQTLCKMPSYKVADEAYQKIVADYEEEIERNDKEFQRQYIDYLHVQSQLSNTILQKRQKELMQLSENSLSFKKSRSEMLSADRDSLMAPVKAELQKAIKDVADILQLEYVIDSSNDAYLYIGKNGVDITTQVYGILNIAVEEPVEESEKE